MTTTTKHRPQPGPRERPILFTGEMIRALLAGTKTQTRRVEPLPSLLHPGLTLRGCPNGRAYYDNSSRSPAFEIGPRYGVPGDSLYPREAFAPRPGGGYLYRADDERAAPRWKPGIHMPKEASRIRLPIAAHERVERLVDISEEDARAEGVKPEGTGPTPYRDAYLRLWDSINGERGFPVTLNPWVRVVTFERAIRVPVKNPLLGDSALAITTPVPATTKRRAGETP